MNPALIERLLAVARNAEAAGHGRKRAVYEAAAQDLGISVATLHRRLKEVTMTKPRKRRDDAGTTALTLEEARIISGYLMESCRANGKRLASIENALEVLRSNNMVRAERVDISTGEVLPLSVSAVSRGLTRHGLHPDQLNQPSPKVQMSSRHPNHVWQIDPSLCVLYYLPKKQGDGLQVMSEKEFYKNKPANIRKIEKERVWRYVITDHTSGVIYVHYVLGAETGQNLTEAFINATQRRHPKDPFNGVPLMVMVDPGSANTGAVFKNLCRALNVDVQVNRPGQPWGKGQVEQANDTVERDFEHRLKFLPNAPQTLDEINTLAWAWMRAFNSSRTHTRTQRTRYDVWLTITQEQLRLAPPPEVMRELAYSATQTRKVTPQLTIKFGGHEYSVSHVPDVVVGATVDVCRNPWREDGSAQVMTTNSEGREVAHVIEPIERDEYGFSRDAVEIGSGYRAHQDTRSDTERKAVERLVTQTDTDADAEKARRKKAVPFGGTVDSMKPINDTPLADYIPKRGTESEITGPAVEIKPLSHVEAAKILSKRLGDQWKGAEHFTWLQKHYADGVPRDVLPQVEQQLTTTDAPAPLRVVK